MWGRDGKSGVTPVGLRPRGLRTVAPDAASEAHGGEEERLSPSAIPVGAARTRCGGRGRSGGRAERFPRGGTHSAVPSQAGALVAVLRKESAGSRGWRRPEFHKTGRRDDSAHARPCRAAGPFLLVATRQSIRALGGGVSASWGGGGAGIFLLLGRLVGRRLQFLYF